MIYFDQIVDGVNGGGGVSVLFRELKNNLKGLDYLTVSYDEKGEINLKPRIMERYRDIELPFKLKDEDIVHSTYYRIPKARNCKVVTTVHDFTYERMLGGLKKIVHSTQKRRAILSADKVICVSKNTMDDLMFYVPEVDPSNIEVVHNGVSNIFSPSNSNCCDDYVLFVGARWSYKNFLSAVEALANLKKRMRLICVGGGEFTSEEKKLLDKSLGCGFYQHAGYVSTVELRNLYRSAYALLYPSLYEGFGIPILEAFKCGCPVIAVNSSSVPEVAGGAAMLSNTGDSHDLRDCLLKLADQGVRADLIEKGLKQCSKFSWEKTAKEMATLYRSLHDCKV